MTEVRALNTLADFIRTVTADCMLKKPDHDKDDGLVPPVVCVQWLPPKNYLPEGYDIPCIIVSMDDGEDNGENAYIAVRITFAVYDAGDTNEEEELVPDMKGYIDLLHVMTKVRLALLTKRIIGPTEVYCDSENPYKWGMYKEENTYPYFYGWAEFNARIATQQYMPVEDNYLKGDDYQAHIAISAQASEQL